MRRIITTLAFALLFSTGFSQSSPLPKIVEGTVQYKELSQPVYQLVLPNQESLEKKWSKHLKDKFGEKLSETKGGVLVTDEFEIPYSTHKGTIRSWVEYNGDSAILKSNMSLGENIFSNRNGFEREDSLFLAAIDQFNYNYRVEYYQDKIKGLKRKRKDLEKSIKAIENTIKSNDKVIKESQQQAKSDDVPNKNELLGRVKDLDKQNQKLEEERSAKKAEAIGLDKEIKYYGKLLKELIDFKKNN